MKVLFKLSPFAKAVVAFVVGLITVGAKLVADGSFDTRDAYDLGAAAVAALAVYVVPNRATDGEGVE